MTADIASVDQHVSIDLHWPMRCCCIKKSYQQWILNELEKY